MCRPWLRHNAESPPARGRIAEPSAAIGEMAKCRRVAVGGLLERFWPKSKSWWVVTVKAERTVTKGRKKVRQVKVHFLNERGQKNDAWLEEQGDELRPHLDHVEHFDNDDGYVTDDQWEVERITEAKGNGKQQSYKVRLAAGPIFVGRLR